MPGFCGQWDSLWAESGRVKRVAGTTCVQTVRRWQRFHPLSSFRCAKEDAAVVKGRVGNQDGPRAIVLFWRQCAWAHGENFLRERAIETITGPCASGEMATCRGCGGGAGRWERCALSVAGKRVERGRSAVDLRGPTERQACVRAQIEPGKQKLSSEWVAGRT